jgi:short-subunit dehydrogenase
VVDFASPSSREEKFAELGQMVQSLDLGVLVNNVGASHEMPVAFAETEAEEIDNIVQTVSCFCSSSQFPTPSTSTTSTAAGVAE